MVKEIETNPKFLQVHVAPVGDAAKSGVYRVEVDLKNAPQHNCLGSNAGFIRLKTDHPRLSTIEVRVQFVALAKG